MTDTGKGWTPSPREQRLLWWLQMLLRFVVGGGGIVWELLVDSGRNPLVLLTCAVLASSLDVFKFVKQVLQQARSERAELEAMLDEERRLDHGDARSR